MTLEADNRSAISRRMSLVKQKHTAPEVVVRQVAHSIGLRFRIHRRDLPGRPDLVLRKHRCVVFVNGCFWHQHEGCRRASSPKSNTGYWSAKLAKNVARDIRNKGELDRLGWRVVVVWECETKDRERLAEIIRERALLP